MPLLKFQPSYVHASTVEATVPVFTVWWWTWCKPEHLHNPKTLQYVHAHMNWAHTLTHLPHLCFICTCTTALLPHVIGLYRIFLWFFKNWGTPSELSSKPFITTGCLYCCLANFVWLIMCIIWHRHLHACVFKLSVTKYTKTVTKHTCEVGKTLILFNLES